MHNDSKRENKSIFQQINFKQSLANVIIRVKESVSTEIDKVVFEYLIRCWIGNLGPSALV